MKALLAIIFQLTAKIEIRKHVLRSTSQPFSSTEKVISFPFFLLFAVLISPPHEVLQFTYIHSQTITWVWNCPSASALNIFDEIWRKVFFVICIIFALSFSSTTSSMKSCIFYPHSTYNFEVFNKYSNYLVHLLLFCLEFSVGLTHTGTAWVCLLFLKKCPVDLS